MWAVPISNRTFSNFLLLSLKIFLSLNFGGKEFDLNFGFHNPELFFFFFAFYSTAEDASKGKGELAFRNAPIFPSRLLGAPSH
jgi:hypothetical protein